MVTEDPQYHKIIFAGLARVGKTSIYKSVIENVDLETGFPPRWYRFLALLPKDWIPSLRLALEVSCMNIR